MGGSRAIEPKENPISSLAQKMFKVIVPIERKDGKTHWLRVGTAFPNRDESINLYLDVMPMDKKLQIRELDEDDLRGRGRRDSNDPGPSPGPDAGDLPF